MSTFRPYSIPCACGRAFRTELAVAVNPVRMPKLRTAILEGRLHRVTCPYCANTFTVEKRFVYADLRRKLIVHVHPKSHAFRWKTASRDLDEGLAELDGHGVLDGRIPRRVAFGIGELREKLVAQDAKVDDRHVELAKVLAVHEHPVLLKRPRLRLFLDKVTDQGLEFGAGYDHADQAFRVAVPRFAFDRVAKIGEQWVKAAHRLNIFRSADDHWVSVQRWAPINTALATLHDEATTVRAGGQIDLDSPEFGNMLSGLPHGSQLTSTAKVDLRDLERYAKAAERPDIQDALFEVRFGVTLDDEWDAAKATAGIDTLWDLLKDLPDTNVEGNSHLHEIFLKPGEGGGLYNPTSQDVEVTSPADDESFPSVMRHEVGHAVQDKLDNEQHLLVTSYLARQFGWRLFPRTSAGARAWGDAMGAWNGLTDAQISNVCDTLTQSLGQGESWTPPPPAHPPAGDPWWRPDFGPRLAAEGSLANWYSSNQKWYRKDGYAYFLNYWYPQFMIVSVGSLDFINNRMPWDYAAMSPGEFFAELYALYYGPDPRKQAIDPATVAWLNANVGLPRAGAPAPPP
jgi:hypothetical protein